MSPTYDPAFARLLDWVEAHPQASPDDRIPASGPAAEADVAWIRSFLELADVCPLPAPPPILRQRLRQSFERRQGRLALPTTYIATLLVDTRRTPELAGVRGGDPRLGDDGFQLAFTTPVGNVYVEIEPVHDGGWNISGQVVLSSFGPPVFQARAVHDSGVQRSVDGDGNGQFRLEGAPVGVHALELDNGQVRLQLALDLETPA